MNDTNGAAGASEMQKPSAGRTAIIVLGMHRSGTSALTRMLSLLGAHLPEHVLGANPTNKAGHWEPERLVNLHDQMLGEAGSCWYDWRAFDPGTLPPGRLDHYRAEIARIISEEYGDAPLIVLKDPRICRFVPLYETILADMGIAPRYVLVQRNPLGVIASLATRNEMTSAYAGLLWLRHVLDGEAETRGRPRVFLSYEDFLDDWREAARRMSEDLALAWPRVPDEAAGDIENHLTRDLQHHAPTLTELDCDPNVTDWIKETYHARLKLTVAENDPDALAKLNHIRNEFDRGSPTFGGAVIPELIARDTRLAEAHQQLSNRDEARNLEMKKSSGVPVEARTTESGNEDMKTAIQKEVIDNIQELLDSREDFNNSFEMLVREFVLTRQFFNDQIGDLRREIISENIEKENSKRRIIEAEYLVRCREKEISDLRDELLKSHKKNTSLSQFALSLNRRGAFILWKMYRGLKLSDDLRRKINIIIQNKFPRFYIFIIENRVKFNKNELKSDSQLIPVSDSGVIFSVVIPIYDRTEEVRQAIESVLAQSLSSFELILVLDGSPSETRKVVFQYESDPRVKIFQLPIPSGNAVRPRNKGIKESKGEYVCFLDSDDIAEQDRLEQTYMTFRETGADVVYGAWRALIDGTRDVDGLSNGQVVRSPDCDLEMLIDICVPCQSTVSVRRSFFDKTGYLKPVMRYREDHELWARLAYNGAQFASTKAVLATLRLHRGNNELNFKHQDQKWKETFLVEYKKSGPKTKKICFLIDGFGISGGTAMIMKHAMHLQSKGHDVTLITISKIDGESEWWPGNPIPIVSASEGRGYLFDGIDILFATFWTTAEWLPKFSAKRKIYYVQSDERLFYEEEFLKERVANTYKTDCEYVVVSNWIADFLMREFEQRAYVVPNGIDLTRFYPDEGAAGTPERRVRVLLEGPIDLPMKGMADAYQAISELSCDIWIVSSAGRPKKDWRYSEFFESVPKDRMREIYSSCDILVKMSRVESFCLPALEAMACGCCVAMARVSGGVEYLEHEVNSLVVEKGDIAGMRDVVQRLISSPDLRGRLRGGGFETARRYSLDTSLSSFEEVIDGDGH